MTASQPPELIELTPTTAAATKTATAQLVARAIAVMTQVASLGVVARATDDADWASWGTVAMLVVIASFLVDPGLSPILVRRLTTDPAATPLPRAVLGVRGVLGTVAVLVVVGVTAALRGADGAVLALAFGGQLLPRALLLNATPWLQVDQRLHRQTALEAAAALLGLSGIVIAAASDAPVWMLGLVGFTLPTCALALVMRRELRITPSRRLDVPGPQAPRLRSVLHELGPFALALVIVAAYTRLSAVFLDLADVSDVEQGRFFYAFQFIEQLIVACGIVAAAVLPLLAARSRTTSLIGDSVTERLLVAVTAVGALLAAVTIALAGPVTDVIAGSGKEGAGADLVLMSPMAALVPAAMILGYVYVAIGRAPRYLRFALAGLVVNVALNVAFTLPHGVAASARITWITEAVVLVLPIAPLVAAGRGGRIAGLTIAALFGSTVIAAELAGPVLAPAVAGAALALVALALGARHLRWLGSAALGRSA